MSLLKELEPSVFWKHFYNITRIPRPSGNESDIRQYVENFAKDRQLEYKIDKIGNIIVKKPASAGKEENPSVLLQGHMDMVCEKNRDKVHDFLRDPIPLVIEDGWLKADGTTLGADNGVAIAAGLMVLESKESMPAIELLLTVDEERGLTGAMELDSAIIDSRILVNLDSEEDDVLYNGCAGGINTEGYIPVSFENAPSNRKALKVEITGLRGGHSGGEIHLGLGNAISIGARFLWKALDLFNIDIAEIEGGGKHNAIPREFFAKIYIDKNNEENFYKFADKFKRDILKEYEGIEPRLSFRIEDGVSSKEIFTKDTVKRLLNLIYSIPHGVIKFSKNNDGLVKTSTNLARVELLLDGKGIEGANNTGKTEFFVLTCQRSSSNSECMDIANKTSACISAAGGRTEYKHEYPGWEPDPDSAILKKARKIYRNMHGVEPKIKAIHAGLECGVIGSKFNSIDMISFGPKLSDVHTPGEKMKIDSVKKFCDFLLELLKAV